MSESNTPEQKRRKPTTRELRGMTKAEWKIYERGVDKECHRFHRECIARGLYVASPKSRREQPSYNPFLTARAIGTQATAIV